MKTAHLPSRENTDRCLWCGKVWPCVDGSPPSDEGRGGYSACGPSLPADAAARKALPVYTYITEYFPDALLAEVAVAVAGNAQHNPGEPLHWAREKSTDQMDCAMRHMLDHKTSPRDTDGQYHLAKAIWRLKAELQLLIEAERRAETTRGA